MLRLAVLFTFWIAVLASTSWPAAADRGGAALRKGSLPDHRVALVVGNGSYRHVAPLANPRNDAAAMAGMLRSLGFEVIEGTDLDRHAMSQVIGRFAERARSASVTFFYFAGHGIQVGGENHLLPVDVDLDAEGLLELQTVKLDLILSMMAGTERIAIALLDACRDDPTKGTRAATRSLAGGGLAVPREASGVMVGFATAPGRTAADGEDGHSPFARALLDRLPEPGIEIGQSLRRVMGDVARSTGGRQRPWVHSDIYSEFYMVPDGREPDPVREPRDMAAVAPQTPRKAETAPEVEPEATPDRRSISVFAHQSFDLCGFRDFKVSGSGSAVRIASRDPAIPNRPFRGYEASLPLGVKVELWPGCSVTVTKTTAARTERITLLEEKEVR